MNQEYSHKNIPLNTSIVRELICELYAGKEYVKRAIIIEEVLQYHLDQGGKSPEVQLAAIVSDVLGKMKNEGRAERRSGSPGFWKILPNPEQEDEGDIFEGLKAIEGRIERLEKVLLLVLSSEIGNYVSASAERYLRNFQSFTVNKLELLQKEYGSLEKVIEEFPNIIEDKSRPR